jgi:hypothetical protein
MKKIIILLLLGLITFSTQGWLEDLLTKTQQLTVEILGLDVQDAKNMSTLEEILKERKVYLLSLAEKEPENFLAAILPAEKRTALLKKFKELVEEDKVAQGILNVGVLDDFARGKSSYIYLVTTADREFMLSSPKGLDYLKSGIKVCIKGLGIGNIIVVENPESQIEVIKE